eukprot:gene4518-7896_t
MEQADLGIVGYSAPEFIRMCKCCKNPIINYGRLMPCKHYFCFSCAAKMKNCDW